MFGRQIKQYFQGESHRFIGVIGCARSGTTLMFNYLNEFKDVFLACEDNPFFESQGCNYRTWYNSHWASLGKTRTKGYYLPEWGGSDGFWFDYYYEISQRYANFGTKLAFGPHGESYWNSVEQRGFDFFNEYFFEGFYILTVRRPAEGIYSMKKMFPGADFGTLKNTWIKSLQFQLSLHGSMKRAPFVFLEDIDIALLEDLNGAMGLSPAPLKTDQYIIENNRKPSRLQEGLPDILMPYEAQIAELEKAYAFLRKDLGKNGTVNGWVHREELCRSMWHALEGLRADASATFPLA
ncbi:hypothetical protein [Azospirillum formosense]|uniref:hypothetical protein n=1 Tax=Azospirillum formosense TaxID=861533 RepID=UPI00338F27F6